MSTYSVNSLLPRLDGIGPYIYIYIKRNAMSTTFSQHFYNKFEVAGYYWLLHVTAKNESQW